MKICKECDFCEEKVVDMQLPNGQSIPQMGMVCMHEECRDPVVGEQIPCNISRREQAFCGIQGKYYKLKEVKPMAPVIQLVS